MRPGPRFVPAALLALALAPAALAEERVGVRAADHPGHGRIVFDWREAPDYTLEQAGGTVRLRFPPGSGFDTTGLRRLPRNVLGIEAGAEAVEIGIRPGTRARHYRLGAMVVVDLLDPVPARPPAAAPPPPEARAAPPPAAAPQPAAAAPAPPPAEPAAVPAAVAAAPARRPGRGPHRHRCRAAACGCPSGPRPAPRCCAAATWSWPSSTP